MAHHCVKRGFPEAHAIVTVQTVSVWTGCQCTLQVACPLHWFVSATICIIKYNYICTSYKNYICTFEILPVADIRFCQYVLFLATSHMTWCYQHIAPAGGVWGYRGSLRANYLIEVLQTGHRFTAILEARCCHRYVQEDMITEACVNHFSHFTWLLSPY